MKKEIKEKIADIIYNQYVVHEFPKQLNQLDDTVNLIMELFKEPERQVIDREKDIIKLDRDMLQALLYYENNEHSEHFDKFTEVKHERYYFDHGFINTVKYYRNKEDNTYWALEFNDPVSDYAEFDANNPKVLEMVPVKPYTAITKEYLHPLYRAKIEKKHE